MGGRHLLVDLSLVRQGLVIESEFGTHALAGMVRVAEFLESSIYRRGSLRRSGPDSFRFTLVNPPMRLGAFLWAQLSWNGKVLEPHLSRVGSPDGGFRAFQELSRKEPLVLGIGETVEFEGPLPRVLDSGRPTVTLALKSVAIPPTVWIRITDELRP